MSYTFDIVGVTPVLDFFYYQEKVEQNPKRSKAYLASYQCTLDGFIQSTEMIVQKPDWNWDEVLESMVKFWLHHADSIEKWKQELETFGDNNLIIARVANVNWLRYEFQYLLDE
jgi:hypothetical protein